MGAAMAIAGPVMSLAGKGASIAGGIAEGIQKKAASQVEAAKLKFAAEVGKVRGQQVDAAYRDELNDTMANISVIRASQNVGFDSPTSFALYEKADTLSDRARIVAVANEKMKALGLEGDSGAALAAGRMARTTSMLKTVPTMLSAGQEIAGFFK